MADYQDVSGLPQDDTMAQFELQRKLKMADALRQSQMPQGQMVGNRFVAPSWTQYAANALDKYVGSKTEENAMKQYGEYTKSKEQRMADVLKTLGSALEPKTVTNTTMQAQDVPLAQGMNVPTSPFQTSDQVAQIAPKFDINAPAPQNMAGTTTQMNPVTSTSTVQPTTSDIEQAFSKYATDVRDPKLLASILTGKYEKMLKDNEPIKLGAGETLLNQQTMQPLYTAPNKPAVEKTPQIQQLLAYQKTLDPNSQDYKVISDAIKHETTFSPNAATMSPNQNYVENTAQMIANGQIQPLSGIAMRTPYGQAVMSRVSELNPSYSGATFANVKQAEQKFNVGKQGDTVRSLNVAVNHLDTLGQLSEALNNNDINMFNKIGNTFAQQTGNPVPTNFNAAKKIVADEIVKGIVGSGGGVADREEAAANINAANSPAQLKGVIDTYKQLLGGQLSGLKQQYEVSTGKKDFNKFISENTQKNIGDHSQTPKSNAPAIGEVKSGYRFKGGNPADQNSWEKM